MHLLESMYARAARRWRGAQLAVDRLAGWVADGFGETELELMLLADLWSLSARELFELAARHKGLPLGTAGVDEAYREYLASTLIPHWVREFVSDALDGKIHAPVLAA